MPWRRPGLPPSAPALRRPGWRGSKLHAKELMAEAGSRPRPTSCSAPTKALEEIASSSFPAVLKADGLAAGKG